MNKLKKFFITFFKVGVTTAVLSTVLFGIMGLAFDIPLNSLIAGVVGATVGCATINAYAQTFFRY